MGKGVVSRGPRCSLLCSGLLPLLLSGSLIASEPVEGYALIDPSYALQITSLPSGAGGTGEQFIRLGATHFDPLTAMPAPRENVADIKSFEPGAKGYYIVQFDGPIMADWKDRLLEAGVEIFDYIPDFSFIVRMTAAVLPAVEGMAHVRWVGVYQPAYRISQATMDSMATKAAAPGDPVAEVDLKVSVFPGEDSAQLEEDIAAMNGRVTKRTSTHWRNTLMITLPADRIGDLAAINGVKWIETAPQWRLHNNASTDVMAVRTPRDAFGLYGEGQTVGVCDTGLDQGSALPASLHDDFEDGSGTSRVDSLLDLVGFGDGAEDNNGHGTHVAGSVLGNGAMSGCTPSSNLFPDTCFAGIAPKANLVFQAVADDGGSLSGIPVDLNDLFSQADTAGADLHTNSWGSDVMSMYTGNSEEVDQYMWDNKDFLILFAASNDGTDLDEDGVVDLYSLGAPATAKNCLTVGASEGNRPTSPDGAPNITWGSGWPNDYPVNPINSDHVSDDPAGVAAFSSRGPVIDGRYKPDILAPGSNILSTKSALGGSGWGAHTSNNSYIWMGGTSMATPLTAGAAALMREYLIKEEGFAPPSAALIKAALLNSAEDTAPGQYGTGATQEIPNSPVPNNVSGWGRVNLWNGVYPAAPYEILFHDESVGLNTGSSKEFTFSVKDSNAPLNVNLVWTDYPGSTVAQGGLVNDLDFQVIGPATTYYPDNALQSAPLSTLQHDNGSLQYFFGVDHAVRFTPSSYPAIVDSVSFFFYETSVIKTDVDIVVYDDNGAGGLPGTELYRKTLNYLPSGYRTIGISGVSIPSGDFYVAIEQPSTSQGVVGYAGNTASRSYMFDGSDWVLSDYTYIIRANVRGLDYSTNYDRVNNAVGLSLSSPPAGAYTVRVSGYNIPQGPQPYALVISGDVSSASSLCGADGSGIDWDGVDNTGGLESTDSCFTSVATTISGSHVVEGTGDLTILYGSGGSVRLQPNFTASGTLSIRRE